MKIEKLVSSMMTMSVKGRLWHWLTPNAQHHKVFEDFLNQNTELTDSLVESALGNSLKIALEKAVAVKEGLVPSYSIDSARKDLSTYRDEARKAQDELDLADEGAKNELTTILDDVIELCSKSIYMLRLK